MRDTGWQGSRLAVGSAVEAEEGYLVPGELVQAAGADILSPTG
jgi:hypothetical protein